MPWAAGQVVVEDNGYFLGYLYLPTRQWCQHHTWPAPSDRAQRRGSGVGSRLRTPPDKYFLVHQLGAHRGIGRPRTRRPDRHEALDRPRAEPTRKPRPRVGPTAQLTALVTAVIQPHPAPASA